MDGVLKITASLQMGEHVTYGMSIAYSTRRRIDYLRRTNKLLSQNAWPAKGKRIVEEVEVDSHTSSPCSHNLHHLVEDKPYDMVLVQMPRRTQ